MSSKLCCEREERITYKQSFYYEAKSSMDRTKNSREPTLGEPLLYNLHRQLDRNSRNRATAGW